MEALYWAFDSAQRILTFSFSYLYKYIFKYIRMNSMLVCLFLCRSIGLHERANDILVNLVS